MIDNKDGFGIIIKGEHRDIAERVFPTKETLSKPIPRGKHPVEHYMHEYKHQTGGRPPQSKEQAIAIGLSVTRDRDRKRKQHQQHKFGVKKAVVAPGQPASADRDKASDPQGISHIWRPAPRSKLNRMRLWDHNHGKWVYRDRTNEDDVVWSVPPGATPASRAPSVQKVSKPAKEDVEAVKEREALTKEPEQQMVRRTSVALGRVLKEQKKEKEAEQKKKLEQEKQDRQKKSGKIVEGKTKPLKQVDDKKKKRMEE
jgi:hypothetical protein